MTTGAPISEPERQQMGRKHIFSVNGSSVFLNLVRDLLEVERYNITTTNFVPRTFEQIASLQPDLVIIDIVVGIQSGWDLLEALARGAETAAIPVIVCSTEHRSLAEAERLAAQGSQRRYLLKPFDIEQLLALVHELIGEA